MSPTSYTTRPTVNTTYQVLRLWWAYLMNNLWQYILTKSWARIIVKVRWWSLNITSYNTRPVVNTSYNVRPII